LAKERITQNEQYSRSKNVIIYGIPQTMNEDLPAIVAHVAQDLGVQITVTAVHRLDHKKLHSGVIVVTSSKQEKNALIHARIRKGKIYAAKRLFPAICQATGTQDDKMITIAEQLCATQRDLYFRTRANAEQLGFSRCFTNDGRIFLQEDKGKPKRLIKHVEHLNELLDEKQLVDIYVERQSSAT
jgi:hypothetical protein